ncbi:MAG TPA: Gfo/Idh/MocA family oxidoreductase [Candidatus Angelobacter sp.]|nr:Gfo/Idh/MocA family oxidoreductase [Candidatus Angelobacter sp.]
MKQVLVRSGSVTVQEVPAPVVSPRNILVRVRHSCISAGTEMAGVKMSGLPLYRRALKQPHHVKRVLQMMRDHGIKRVYDRVTGQLEAGLPTGYSAAGEVVTIGEQVEGFQPGDMVACAGAGIANHAEVIDVPVNLAVKIPDGLTTELACTVTLGAIAMQGLRRANPTLGETVVVLGLGLLGQVTAQLLSANGCRVIGTDPDSERVSIAEQGGMDFGIVPGEHDLVDRVHRLTDGIGADAAIITAATSSHEVISQAMQCCRKKGRVVLVGDVGLNLDRNDLYKKELDFLISSSYGPGRYDPLYEEGGQDYPLPYVRWTENRNMEEYLNLLARGRIRLGGMPQRTFSIARAVEAYESLNAAGPKSLLTLLEYPDSPTAFGRRISVAPVRSTGKQIRVALVGAGNFAQAMHVPNLLQLSSDFKVQCVMSRTGANARAAATRCQAAYATSDYDHVLSDPDIDLVLIATRHNLHGRMALHALRAGKSVFVEKPLTIFPQELEEIEDFFRNTPNAPLLMVGFNRRFSPPVQAALKVLASRSTPLIVNYRMNAGYIPSDHWTQTEEGGGRNLGEACHIYDLFNAFTASRYTAVSALPINSAHSQWKKTDNFVASISYADGSVCSLTYTALGDKSFPKETMDIFADGKVISLHDYKSLSVAGGKNKGWKSMTQQKGQLEELKALAASLRGGSRWPIPLDQIIQTTRVSFEIEQQLTGKQAAIPDGAQES